MSIGSVDMPPAERMPRQSVCGKKLAWPACIEGGGNRARGSGNGPFGRLTIADLRKIKMRDKTEPEKKTSSIDINLLLDFYGPLLAERQRQTVEMYYGDDMTLSEIASELGISRQAAQQSIRKGCGQLEEFERKLGLCGRFAAAEDTIRELRRSAEVLANRETAESEAVSEAGRVYEYLDSLEKLI